MIGNLPPMTLKAIGTIRSKLKKPHQQECSQVVSEIVVDSNLTEALDNLDEFSHIIVLYFMHQVDPNREVPMKVHPKGRQEATPVGVFASRSPNRPNPIGITTVRLLKRQGNVLKVEGLDAIDGSPVIDLKPYIPGYDSVADGRVPPWVAVKTDQVLTNIYHRLLDRYGPQQWWPAEEPFEVIVGAILTQSVSWLNVERAIANLKGAGALSPQALRQLDIGVVARLIRPCGYYNAKALKLKSFARFLGERYQDNLEKLFSTSLNRLREQLLGVHGIGQETADSIILYAAAQPIFVIDAYTRRITSRLGLAPKDKSYSAYQLLFMQNLPGEVRLFNEYHALLVCLAKDVCRRQPLCPKCCLNDICRFYIISLS